MNPRRNLAARRTLRAFTLFELVLVLFIIAAALTIAAPSFAGFGRGRALADIATDFAASTRFARTRAITDGLVTRVTVDPKDFSWWLTQDDGAGQFAILQAPQTRTFTLPAGITLKTDAPLIDEHYVVEFQPTGRTDIATITFTGKSGPPIDVTTDGPFENYHVVKTGGQP